MHRLTDSLMDGHTRKQNTFGTEGFQWQRQNKTHHHTLWHKARIRIMHFNVQKTLKKTINSSRLYYCAIHWNGTIIKWHSAVLQGQRDPIALWLPISVKLFLDSICTCKLTGYITVCQVCSKQQKHTIIII